MAVLVFIVVVLLVLAIADLVVGVSNDAVNFLNSAIGSRVAPVRIILFTAIAGILAGSLFSSGIMEIARKGIFYPQYFTLDIIMWVFLAVMLTDIVLLDVFNTLGLPTSTTVSIVFELLGAAFVAGILFSAQKDDSINSALRYLNAASSITIIAGIFLSVIIAFTSGIVLQYLSRLLFTFNYEEKLERYGALYAGVGITSIVYFLLIKGLKGTTLISKPVAAWIGTHTLVILGTLLAVATLLCYITQKYYRVNPLKVVVLAGTFSLAMAFAGNDLVNFIGVPITGFLAFENWLQSGVPSAEHYQHYLAGNDVVVPNYMLLLAGVVMSATLWYSAKARKVTETEVSLGRQGDGDERFRPNAVSRSIVKSAILMGDVFKVFLPTGLVRRYDLSFQKSKMRKAIRVQDKPAFDLVRAASNLIISSILIASATSMKLPLSTTYVTFMVAMGTSLADKAWGRESAVYRVAGVLSVIGGWFITALIAFAVSGLFVFILYKGGIVATIALLAVVIMYIVYSHVIFAKNERKAKAAKNRMEPLHAEDQPLLEKNRKLVSQTLTDLQAQYTRVMDAVLQNDMAALEAANATMQELNQHGLKLRAASIRYLKELQSTDRKAAELLLYSADLLQDITQSATALTEECYHYLQNLHPPLNSHFMQQAQQLRNRVGGFMEYALHIISTPTPPPLSEVKQRRDDARSFIHAAFEQELPHLQHQSNGTRQGVLQTSMLLQSRDILAVTFRLVKLYCKFV